MKVELHVIMHSLQQSTQSAQQFCGFPEVWFVFQLMSDCMRRLRLFCNFVDPVQCSPDELPARTYHRENPVALPGR